MKPFYPDIYSFILDPTLTMLELENVLYQVIVSSFLCQNYISGKIRNFKLVWVNKI